MHIAIIVQQQQTALHKAVQHCYLEVADLLLSFEASIDVKDEVFVHLGSAQHTIGFMSRYHTMVTCFY